MDVREAIRCADYACAKRAEVCRTMERGPYSHLFLFLLLVSLFVLPTAVNQILGNNDAGPDNDMQAQALLRAQFYENLGQFPDNSVKYYGAIPGGFVGFSEDAVLLWSGDDPNPVRMSFVNSAHNAAPFPEDEVAHRTNYFLGDRGTFTGVRGYRNIIYADLWEQIDLTFDARVDGAEYEFIVRSGGDPARIAISFEGYEALRVEGSSLVIDTGESGFVHDGLFVYQGRTEVDAQFTEKEHGALGFDIGPYDRSETLVIDPLIYSTFIGGTSHESGTSIAVDLDGNAYVSGATLSSDFPAVNAYDGSLSGSYDCFVVKLSAAGNSLLYSTFIGGTDGDSAGEIRVDSAGNVYMCGTTMSPDFPTVNAYDSSLNGYADCFVLKLNATGNALVYSTLVGGVYDDIASSLAIDSDGNAYACGTTESPDFPTANACDSSFSASEDCFVLKLNATGNGLLYSTFIGDDERNLGLSIAVDSDGNAFVCGRTNSSDFPTVNAYDASFNGYDDCFMLKLNATGNGLLYSTFIGGDDEDWMMSMAVDLDGNAYVCGTTMSPDFPTVNAYDSSHNNPHDFFYYDCFMLKLNATGNGLVYSTFIGGNDQDLGNAIAVDSAGNAYMCGTTQSPDFPIVNGYDVPINETSSYDYDCFVLELNSTGGSLLYSALVGGGSYDWANSIAVDLDGNAYVCGSTSSTDFPTVNPYDESYGGPLDWYSSGDCFVLKLTPGPPPISPLLLGALVIGVAGGGAAVVAVLFVVQKKQSSRTA